MPEEEEEAEGNTTEEEYVLPDLAFRVSIQSVMGLTKPLSLVIFQRI
jgi:hypothetical protein